MVVFFCPYLRTYSDMLPLRRHINIRSFFITIEQIARHLGLSIDRILNWEKWQHVLWVHIKGRGGYFISYRKLEQWISACCAFINNSRDIDSLKKIWSLIQKEFRRYTSEGLNKLINAKNKRKIYLTEKSKIMAVIIQIDSIY